MRDLVLDRAKAVQRKGWRFGLDVARYDPRRSLNRLLPAQFAAYGINCVLDVGAHRGETGAFLRSLGYRGRIVSFEPVPESFEALRLRAEGDPAWTVHQLALGRETGVMPMNIAAGSDLSSFLAPKSDTLPGWAAGTRQIERTENVRVERLDAIFGECVRGLTDPRVFLKLDTQGWDLEVLAGAEGMLDAVRVLQTEVSVQPLYEGMSDFCTSIRAIQQLGFRPTAFFPIVLVEGFAAVEFDCVAVR